MRMRGVAILLSPLLLGASDVPNAADYRADAISLDGLIVGNYAYLDRFGGKLPPSARLDAERDAVADRKALLHYAERRIASLADHHAITGSSFADSWAVVPTYTDLWVVARVDGFRIDAVRADSPAARAGIVAGDRLLAVDDVPVAQAVAAFWSDLGIAPRSRSRPVRLRRPCPGRGAAQCSTPDHDCP